MSSNLARPEKWYDLATRLAAGDATVAQDVVEYERRADNVFQRLSRADWVPDIKQGATALTFTATAALVKGYRIGHLIVLNGLWTITNSPAAAGVLSVTTPLQFPASTTIDDGSVEHAATAGQFSFYDTSGGVNYEGGAKVSSLLIRGWAYGQGNYLGAGPVIPVATGDTIALSIQYLTSASL